MNAALSKTQQLPPSHAVLRDLTQTVCLSVCLSFENTEVQTQPSPQSKGDVCVPTRVCAKFPQLTRNIKILQLCCFSCLEAEEEPRQWIDWWQGSLSPFQPLSLSSFLSRSSFFSLVSQPKVKMSSLSHSFFLLSYFMLIFVCVCACVCVSATPKWFYTPSQSITTVYLPSHTRTPKH